MVIGIIGAGLPGLIAGRMLAQGGHEVHVIEKEQKGGGRLATFAGGKNGDIAFDYCNFCFSASDPLFQDFVDELTKENILKVWARRFPFYDDKRMLSNYPGKEETDFYIAPNGMNTIIQYLSRWVDIDYNTQVNGLTFIGANRHKKKAWMINTTSFTPYEVDAIIIATPAIQAYGLINMAQDETDILGLVKDLDTIDYDNAFSLMVTYTNHEIPDWNAMQFRQMSMDWMVNVSSMRDTGQILAMLIQSSSGFYHAHHHESDEQAILNLLKDTAHFGGDWLTRYEWASLYRWKYRKAKNTFNEPFVETKTDDGPIALIGDYMQGNSIESAYLSGYKLAKHWLESYPVT